MNVYLYDQLLNGNENEPSNSHSKTNNNTTITKLNCRTKLWTTPTYEDTILCNLTFTQLN